MINNYYDKKILRKKLTNYLKKKHTKIPSNTKSYWENYITSLVDNTIKNLDSWLWKNRQKINQEVSWLRYASLCL